MTRPCAIEWRELTVLKTEPIFEILRLPLRHGDQHPRFALDKRALKKALRLRQITHRIFQTYFRNRKRPLACECCEKKPPAIRTMRNGKVFIRTQIQGHHEDYAYPLAVIWLCLRCHKIRHGQEMPRASETRRNKVLLFCKVALVRKVGSG